MTLNQALKQKNRLAGELNRLKQILSRENSRQTTSTSNVDREAVTKALLDTMDQLIDLKSKIATANVGIYRRIEHAKELKGMITYLQSLPTTDGVVKEPSYQGTVIEKIFSAHLKQEKIDEMVRQIQTSLEQIQDEIDQYNAVTKFEWFWARRRAKFWVEGGVGNILYNDIDNELKT